MANGFHFQEDTWVPIQPFPTVGSGDTEEIKVTDITLSDKISKLIVAMEILTLHLSRLSGEELNETDIDYR